MKKSLFLLSFFLLASLVFSQERLDFKRKTFNFEEVVKTAGVLKYRFNFKNETKGIVRILGANTDCDFISLDWFRPSIERKEKGYIQVVLNPENEQFGKYVEKIFVYTSVNPDSPIILTLMCNIVDKIPEPTVEPYFEYFGILSESSSVRTKKHAAFIENLANFIIKKGNVVLQVESSMSPMTIEGYSNKIAKSRAENIQIEIIKSVTKYQVNSTSIKFSSSKIVIQGPIYSKKTQGKSKEYGKYQYIKVVKIN